MKIPILALLLSIATSLVFGQTEIAYSEVLSRQEIAHLFSDSIKNQLDINYPIYKVYKCKDTAGEFFVVLTESNDKINSDNDTLNSSIKAFNFQPGQNGLIKKWEIYDFIIRPAGSEKMENSIWFWTKYSEFKDIDNDHLIDPVIIYGTSGINYTDDGRIKIFIYYKGQKYVIRHQNGVYDQDRNTKVDKAFYSLPLKIQDYVKQIMEKMTDDGNAIFPYGWQSAMKAHKSFFDENKK